jgi:DNA-binding transcriptional MerR regulator
MKKFLQKYGVSEEVLTALLEAYKEDGHADATDLPEYIGKSRFDEVNRKLKTSEKKAADLEKQIADLQKGGDDAVKAAVTAKETELNEVHQKEIDSIKRDYAMDTAILKARGKNAKAIKALIDPEKKLEDEIARLQKDEAYLFEGEDDIPGGTGRNGGEGGKSSDKELEAMRNAVGVI